jgi:LmbE family N-acetylglucosaminyl deacetylase
MKRVLIVSPHPDDETFGMGGTILKLKKQNNFIHLLVLSLGGKSKHPIYDERKLKKIRKDETVKAIKCLKIDSYEFADMRDTRIKKSDAYEVIKNSIQRIKPDRIYLPCNPDTHQDHLNTSHAARLAAFHEGVKEILIYDTSTMLSPMDFYEDISDFLEEKIRICEIYNSQVIKNNFKIEKIRARNLARGTEIRTEAAEAFKVVRFVT